MRLLDKLLSLFKRSPNDVSVRLAILERQVKDMEGVLLETIELTGGQGWTHTIQNAIMQLDKRIDAMRNILIQHQQNFESIIEQEEEVNPNDLN